MTGSTPPGGMVVIGRRGDRQHLADRLDPVRLAMIVDERDHGLNRRSSSAWAKYADALRRISLAWRSSRFSRSRAFSFVAPSPSARQARLPLSTLSLLHPVMQRLRRAADLGRDRHDRRPPRRVLALVLQHHPHRALADLRRKLVRCLACHGSIFSRVGASGKPGAVQSIDQGVNGINRAIWSARYALYVAYPPVVREKMNAAIDIMRAVSENNGLTFSAGISRTMTVSG